MLHIANILNLARKIIDKKLQKNIITQVNCNKKKLNKKISSV